MNIDRIETGNRSPHSYFSDYCFLVFCVPDTFISLASTFTSHCVCIVSGSCVKQEGESYEHKRKMLTAKSSFFSMHNTSESVVKTPTFES